MQLAEVEVLSKRYSRWTLKFLEKCWVSCRFPPSPPTERWMGRALPFWVQFSVRLDVWALECLTLAVPLKPLGIIHTSKFIYLWFAQPHLSNSVWLKQRNRHLRGTINLTHFSCLSEVEMNYTLKTFISTDFKGSLDDLLGYSHL